MAEKPVTDIASEGFVDGLEAAEIDHENGRAFAGAVRICHQRRKLFVEHQTVAEFGQGVGTRLGRSLGHVVSADQPAVFHRYRLNPERAAVGKRDLVIGLAVVGAGIAVDAIEQFAIAEQMLENMVGQKQFAVGPDDRHRPVHAHERLERQFGAAIELAAELLLREHFGKSADKISFAKMAIARPAHTF